MSWHHTTTWYKSFLALSQRPKHKLSRLPFAKDRREKITPLRAMTFDDGRASEAQTIVAPPKHLLIEKSTKFCGKKSPIFFSDVEKWNVANRLNRVFPKFRADRSHPRGVNGRLKFSHFERRERRTFKVYQKVYYSCPGTLRSRIVIDGYKIDATIS